MEKLFFPLMFVKHIEYQITEYSTKYVKRGIMFHDISTYILYIYWHNSGHEDANTE